MRKISGTTIAYAAVMLVIVIAVAYLMTRVARTETADRRLLTIAAVIVGAIVVGGLATLWVRGRRSSAEGESDTDSG